MFSDIFKIKTLTYSRYLKKIACMRAFRQLDLTVVACVKYELFDELG